MTLLKDLVNKNKVNPKIGTQMKDSLSETAVQSFRET